MNNKVHSALLLLLQMHASHVQKILIAEPLMMTKPHGSVGALKTKTAMRLKKYLILLKKNNTISPLIVTLNLQLMLANYANKTVIVVELIILNSIYIILISSQYNNI